MTKLELESIKKPNEVVCSFFYEENGINENGFMTYKITYDTTLKNYKLSHIDANSKLAVLQDLDYVEPQA